MLVSLIKPSDLEIEQRDREGVIILDLKGRLVLGPADAALRQRLEQLRASGHLNVILNMKAVTEMDTTALGTLLYGSTKFREAGGRLILLNMSAKHTELSNTVKLSAAFEIYQDEIGALNSFFPDRVVPRYDLLQFVEGLEQRRHSDEPRAKGSNRNGEAGREPEEVSKQTKL